MAVYERTYKRYVGEQTPTATRFSILPRYIFKDVFKSRWTVSFFALSFLYPLACIALIYFSNNSAFLEAFPGFELPDAFKASPTFFDNYLVFQGTLALALVLFIGPGLVSRDLANNGLPLYLSRPFDSWEYVVGKMSVLVILLSAITWVPALLLQLLHANFVGMSWLVDNSRLVLAVIAGSLIWIISLSLLALAVSAWVKWRPVAGFSVLLVLWGGAFFGSAIVNTLFRTDYGHLANLAILVKYAQKSMLGLEIPTEPPMTLVWAAIVLWNAFFVWMLRRKIRAYEVVG